MVEPPSNLSPHSDVLSGVVTAVSRSSTHSLVKANEKSILLVSGFGVVGDVHPGVMVKHSLRHLHFGKQPNVRQLHLIHAELHEELRERGFNVAPGQMGENVTTRGLDLLSLPRGARLHLGPNAVVQLTGLRSPCTQLNRIQQGLMTATLARDAAGNLVRKTGVMAIVFKGGAVQAGDYIEVELPPGPHCPLLPV
jgi:MOSC domain-containing protein YiiM